jgi:signal transduction histidine kinase/ligand-binding sensor domain-containing protein
LDIVHSDDDTFVIDAGSFDLQVGFTRLTCLILMSNLRAIIGLLACVIFSNASAANFSATGTPRYYLVQSWQTDKGLPQNWVSSIAQTPDGYLWVGTRYGGLARFDGVRFSPFNQLDTPELKDVQVEHLSVDRTGRLWIFMGNESVSTFYDGHFELFRPPRSEPHARLDHVLNVQSNSVLFAGEYPYLALLNLSGSNPWSVFDPRPQIRPDPRTFCQDESNNVWFVTEGHRLGCFSRTNFNLIRSDFYDTDVAALALDATRKPWIATSQRLTEWDGENILDHTPTNGPPPENILQIAFSGDGGLWVLEKNRLRKTVNGRWVAEINSDELPKNPTPGSVTLHGDMRGDVWLAVYGRGLWHCKSDGSSHLLNEQTGLPSRFITCWFQDFEGNVWVGMHDGGLARIRERLFQVFGPANGLHDKVVSSTCVDANGVLWAGTMSGTLARWQNKNEQFETVPLGTSGNDPNESITVFPARDGTLWVGSLNHGLANYSSNTITRPQTPWDTVRVLFGDSQNRMWVGGLVNLCCFTNGGYRTYGSGDGFVDSHAIGAIAEAADGVIWIGTGPGELWKFAGGKFSRFRPPTEWPAVRFATVLPDTNNVVWIGTLGGGLLRFRDGQFTRILASDGLPNNNISQLLDSRDGFLWGGTYAGIFRVAKSDLAAVADGTAPRLRCRVYGESDGLPALQCSSGFQPCCWRSEDGHLWFSTANGIASVNPSRTIPNRIPPTVIIEEMLVDGQPLGFPPRIGVPLRSMHPDSPLKIPAGRHYVQVRFTGLNFTAPDGVRFRVELEGGDGKWQDIGPRREIGYGPLAPGDYRFRVLACNNDGIWDANGDLLRFTIMPYFHETWWFRAGLALVTLLSFASAAAMIQRYRYRRRLEHAERQRELEEERARIARDLHDDLGTSLTQISLMSALANRENTPASESKELIQEVRNRSREVVIALDEIVWAVNPKNDTLAGLVNYLGHFAEEFFRPSGIRLRLDLPPELPAVLLTAETRHHLFLAFKEALNNAARHSGATQVDLRVEITPTELAISVKDNGRGVELQSSSEFSNGVANMKRRLEHIGGHAEWESTVGRGTAVTFHAPLTNP